MQFVRPLIAFACLALGALVGALNRNTVTVDLGALSLSTSLGIALIAALLAGVIAGGLAVVAGVVIPLRRRVAQSAPAPRADSNPET